MRTLDDFIQRWKRSKSILDINKTCRNEKNQENAKTGGILLECVSNLLADVLYQEDGSLAEDEVVLETIVEGIRYLNTQTERLAIVTNEVHSDLQDYSEETKIYRTSRKDQSGAWKNGRSGNRSCLWNPD